MLIKTSGNRCRTFYKSKWENIKKATFRQSQTAKNKKNYFKIAERKIIYYLQRSNNKLTVDIKILK